MIKIGTGNWITDNLNSALSTWNDKLAEISRSNASGSDGRLYGVPKDKDNGMLVYNKEMFDAAGVTYPTDDWTWEDMTDASQKIHDATGKYGFMAYNDDQLGYWCFVYQLADTSSPLTALRLAIPTQAPSRAWSSM